MTVQGWCRTALDPVRCRYGQSRIAFRGPARDLGGDYVAFLGGAETYGRFVVTPFPEIIEGQIGVPCVNMGVPNAGVDLYLNEPGLHDVARGARAVVVQLMPAQNLSNLFYKVHPRRNDRFLRATDALIRLYPEVDFTGVHFTRHLLTRLYETAPRRFETVASELRAEWRRRMSDLIEAVDVPVLLVAFGRRPLPARTGTGRPGMGMLDRAMLESLESDAAAVLEVSASDRALREGTLDMVFGPTEVEAARLLPGPLAHDEAAEAIEPVLRGLMTTEIQN